MDPFAKALRISLGLHAGVALAFVIGVFFSEVFSPKPAAVFTVFAPPAGLIAGGPASSLARTAVPDALPIPQGPRLPSPAPAQVKDTAPRQTEVSPSKALPMEEVAPPARKPKTHRVSETGTLPKTKPAPEKLSYSEFQKKYAPKEAPKASAGNATKAASKAKKFSASSVAPSAAPSFEETLASRLDKRFQEEGERTVGTGLGGAPGSGVAGNGIAGATDNADALYTGTVYTYLNSVWEEPREVGTVHLMARVEFTVDRKGAITAWRITRRSGNDSFDKSVEKVFARVKEVSAPPTNQDYRLSVNFETRDS